MTSSDRDFVGYGRTPPAIEWPGGATVALNFAINYEEGSERSHAFGDGRNEGLAELVREFPAEVRDFAAESVYEYGSRAGIWRLARLFDERAVPVTLFAAAVALERNPAVGAWIAEREHDVCAHGWRWEEQWALSRDEEKRHIALAVESIAESCGARPVGWYCRYGPSAQTRELLVEHGGFLYDSDSYADDLPYQVVVLGQSHVVVPYTFAYNDVRYVAGAGFGGPSDFVDLCRRALDELRREGAEGSPKMMSIGLHPRWSGQAGRASGLREFLDYAMSTKDVWIARRRDIAAWWLNASGSLERPN
jgi:peptidoglycan/xylan/chitin deacetylase (PgdA/CDA1 family)